MIAIFKLFSILGQKNMHFSIFSFSRAFFSFSHIEVKKNSVFLLNACISLLYALQLGRRYLHFQRQDYALSEYTHM